MENRLIPVGTQLMRGASSTARNDICLICSEDLGNVEDILVHPGCRNAFCAEDLLTWVVESQGTCPVCRAHLGMRRPIRYDADKERIYLATNGLDEVRSVVGTCFDVAPLNQRIVATHRPLDELISITNHNVHTAMHSRLARELYLAPNELPLIEGQPDPHEKVLDERRHMLLAWMAKDLLELWKDYDGVQYCSEFIFPEFSHHTRFITPTKPEVIVMKSLSQLRLITKNARSWLLDTHGGTYPQGGWLKRIVRTPELLALLPSQSMRAGMDAFNVVSSFSFPGRSMEEVEWAFWQSNHPTNYCIFAVPRILHRFVGPVQNGVATPVVERGFSDDKQQVIFSNQYIPDAGLDDLELYDFAHVFDERFEEEPFPLPSPPGVDNGQEASPPRHSRRVDAAERPLPADGFEWRIVPVDREVRTTDPQGGPAAADRDADADAEADPQDAHDAAQEGNDVDYLNSASTPDDDDVGDANSQANGPEGDESLAETDPELYADLVAGRAEALRNRNDLLRSLVNENESAIGNENRDEDNDEFMQLEFSDSGAEADADADVAADVSAAPVRSSTSSRSTRSTRSRSRSPQRRAAGSGGGGGGGNGGYRQRSPPPPGPPAAA